MRSKCEDSQNSRQFLACERQVWCTDYRKEDKNYNELLFAAVSHDFLIQHFLFKEYSQKILSSAGGKRLGSSQRPALSHLYHPCSLNASFWFSLKMPGCQGDHVKWAGDWTDCGWINTLQTHRTPLLLTKTNSKFHFYGTSHQDHI